MIIVILLLIATPIAFLMGTYLLCSYILVLFFGKEYEAEISGYFSLKESNLFVNKGYYVPVFKYLSKNDSDFKEIRSFDKSYLKRNIKVHNYINFAIADIHWSLHCMIIFKYISLILLSVYFTLYVCNQLPYNLYIYWLGTSFVIMPFIYVFLTNKYNKLNKLGNISRFINRDYNEQKNAVIDNFKSLVFCYTVIFIVSIFAFNEFYNIVINSSSFKAEVASITNTKTKVSFDPNKANISYLIDNYPFTTTLIYKNENGNRSSLIEPYATFYPKYKIGEEVNMYRVDKNAKNYSKSIMSSYPTTDLISASKRMICALIFITLGFISFMYEIIIVLTLKRRKKK